MVRRNLVLACMMSILLCFDSNDGPVKLVSYINEQNSSVLYNFVLDPKYIRKLPIIERDLKTCKFCGYSYSYERVDDEYSRMISKFYGFSLIQLPDFSLMDTELNTFFDQPIHTYCSLFHGVILDKFYELLCLETSDGIARSVFSSLNKSFDAELEWFNLLIGRTSFIHSNDNVEGQMCLMTVDTRPKYSSTQLGMDELLDYLWPRLPRFAVNYIRENYQKPNLVREKQIWLDNPVFRERFNFNNLTELTVMSVAAVHSECVFNDEICKQMIENPFLFFIRVDMNMAMLERLGSLKQMVDTESPNKGGLKGRNIIKLNKEVELATKKFESIIKVIDKELERMYGEKFEIFHENDPLQVILILVIIPSLPVKLIKHEINFISGSVEIYESKDNFQNAIYRLGNKEKIWINCSNSGNPQKQSHSVQRLINFINDYKVKSTNLKQRGIRPPIVVREVKVKERYILFWIAKIVLSAHFRNMPTLCYILYKMDVMKELRIHTIFFYSFICRRLLLNKKWPTENNWFETTDSNNDPFQFTGKVSFRRLVSKETFVDLWNKLQATKEIPRINDLDFYEAVTSTENVLAMENEPAVTNKPVMEKLNEDEVLNKVYDLFSEIYITRTELIEEVHEKMTQAMDNEAQALFQNDFYEGFFR